MQEGWEDSRRGRSGPRSTCYLQYVQLLKLAEPGEGLSEVFTRSSLYSWGALAIVWLVVQRSRDKALIHYYVANGLLITVRCGKVQRLDILLRAKCIWGAITVLKRMRAGIGDGWGLAVFC